MKFGSGLGRSPAENRLKWCLCFLFGWIVNEWWSKRDSSANENSHQSLQSSCFSNSDTANWEHEYWTVWKVCFLRHPTTTIFNNQLKITRPATQLNFYALIVFPTWAHLAEAIL